MLHPNGKVETEIFYKETNTHCYLHYDTHHPSHIKRNIPYNLAKRIIVFTSDSEKEEMHLTQLKEWLLACNYPKHIIDKGIKIQNYKGRHQIL